MLPNLIGWTTRPGEDYTDLEEIYGEFVGQWYRYVNHVAAVIGGVLWSSKSDSDDSLANPPTVTGISAPIVREGGAVVVGDPAVVRIGITDYAQGELGVVVFVNLPKVGDAVDGHQSFGTIEAVKAVSDLYMPVAGEIVEANAALDADPAAVNSDPYGEGWMVVIEAEDASVIDGLMSAEDYDKLTES